MRYLEITRDLFTLPKNYTLAHCIAEDAVMEKGIANSFRLKYPNMREKIQHNNLTVGDIILYEEENKHDVLNLVTKPYSRTSKPTRESLNRTILNLREHVVRNGITKIGLPQIGSGLDRLNWKVTSQHIKEVFKDVDVDIAVCIWR